MVRNTKYLIIPMILFIMGAVYWGYADTKGINNIYGILSLTLGVILIIFVIWFENKGRKTL